MKGSKKRKDFFNDISMQMDEIFEIKSTGLDKLISEKEEMVKMINYMDVYNNKIIYENLNSTSGKLEKISKEKVKKNDILVTPTSETREDIFHSAVITSDFDAVYSYHLMCLRPLIDVDSIYFKYYFDSIYIKRAVGRLTTGTTRMTLSKSDLMKLELSFPNLSKQQKIGKLLSSMDKLIHYTNEQSKKLGIQKSFISNKIFNFITDNKKSIKLGQISKLKSGGTPKSTNKDFYQGNIKFLSISDLNSKYLYDTQKRINEHAISKSSAWIVPSETLVYTMYASPAIPFILKDNIAIPQSVIAIFLDDNIDRDYIYYQLQYKYDSIMSLTMTGTQANLSGDVVKNIKIELVDFELQVKISKLLSSIDQLVELYNNYSIELSNVKKYNLNKIFG